MSFRGGFVMKQSSALYSGVKNLIYKVDSSPISAVVYHRFAFELYFSCLVFWLSALPQNADAQTDTTWQQGYLQYRLQHFDSAVISFTQLISVHPEKKEGYYNRGLSYYHLGKFDEAQRDFNACLQIDSVFDEARFMKALTLQSQGNWQGASDEIKWMNTNYTGYNELKKHIRYHNISVILSRNWYYMIAIMFLFVILVGILAKSYYSVKG
jgi:tetratricopeptide (TPR) repeat protein